jgi:O-antigen ligase
MITAAIENASLHKKETVLMILVKIMFHVVLGILCFTRFPMPVNVVAMGCIVLIFLHTLGQKDYFSFFIQLVFCNHFVFGYETGGTFNLASILALISHYLVYNRQALPGNSVFGRTGYAFFFILLASQVIGLVANYRIGIPAKAFSLGVFTLMIATIYHLSKVKVVYEDYIRFIYVLFFFTCYNLVVAMNQRMFFTNLPIFPLGDPNAEYELNIVRSGGSLLNYEAFAEYSLSMIALLLPGILSGRFKKKSINLFLASLCIIIISLFAIVLSGTRSSLVLLPVVVIFILFSLGKRLKIGYVISFFSLAVGAFLVNMKYEFVDVNVFMERSANMDFQRMTLKDFLSGSEMNRGEVFDFAFKKLGESKGIIPAGYYTKEENYVVAHFDRTNYLPTDYHNLYLSSIVLWGVLGGVILTLFFFISIYQGMKVYFRKRHVNDYTLDLLLGFNTFFLFFMINEYKIQFIRYANYFILMFLFLILYRTLIKNVNTNFREADSE